MLSFSKEFNLKRKLGKCSNFIAICKVFFFFFFLPNFTVWKLYIYTLQPGSCIGIVDHAYSYSLWWYSCFVPHYIVKVFLELFVKFDEKSWKVFRGLFCVFKSVFIMLVLVLPIFIFKDAKLIRTICFHCSYL